MIRRIKIEELMSRQESVAVADVRSPAEFAGGHIPGAFNLPLFSNEERARVGTAYKQVSREEAILLGFDLAGPKWSGFIREALQQAPQKKIAVHCWRGGMRSGAMAWALDLYGFEVFLLEGGYKSYRKWVQNRFAETWQLWVVGGMTGSGKTRVLRELCRQGEQVLDLEDLARHQGSAYGSMGRLVQPSQEQFENDLAAQLQTFDGSRKIWIEDESLMIGKCSIPRPFWDQIRDAWLFDLQVPDELRVQALVGEYGSLDKEFLVQCTENIRKRLGNDKAKLAINAIREDRMDEFVRLVLTYYDKAYKKGLSVREAARLLPVEVTDDDAAKNAAHILEAARTISTSACIPASTHSIIKR